MFLNFQLLLKYRRTSSVSLIYLFKIYQVYPLMLSFQVNLPIIYIIYIDHNHSTTDWLNIVEKFNQSRIAQKTRESKTDCEVYALSATD